MASGFLGSVRQALRMLAKNPASNLHRVVRTRGDAAVLPAIREAIKSLNPYLPIVFAQPMRHYAGIALLPQRIAAWVAGSLGLLGLLLTGIGNFPRTALRCE